MTEAREPDDDAALSWGDAEDATHVDAARNPIAVKERDSRDPDAPETSGALIGFGVFGGLYLLYTVAWLLTASTSYLSTTDAVLSGFVTLLRFLAIVAPALWFAVVIWVARTRSTRTRLLWMLLGAVVLFPWPFLMTRSFG
ncbi:hypothetical protein DEJ33_16380 [Curtobacterium sp. MCPF17_047]|uniref:hypothetical protein n=1 Tax=unclassified Curtobacterium TaxID=257496 RepID=UPI000DA95D73|nr:MULTISPECIES: hypothetical protein [unclassified Curtobacterium]PZE54153.1 hypothetical protein DEJ24_16125 [Curtobacterium sp. MCPF17_001]PZF61492.1 hypothetical protein DEJ33_16380 [Curtobacterium sp. MCPF17_047]WIB12962.1 hypothetical protein DEJ36_02885 [Curtobacterium sp. MCPF17_052]